jgi:hypothetical protein
VVDVAVFVAGLFEELVEVVVFRHVALDECDGRAGFARSFGVDVTKDDGCAVLHQESQSRCSNAC